MVFLKEKLCKKALDDLTKIIQLIDNKIREISREKLPNK